MTTTSSTPTPTATAYAYVRVSTDEQGDSGAGLDAQRAAVTAEATRRGWALDVHDEVASGGSLTGRPVLAGLLDRLDRDGGTLVVSRLDRLSRSVADAAALMDRARRRGWALVALDARGVPLSLPSPSSSCTAPERTSTPARRGVRGRGAPVNHTAVVIVRGAKTTARPR